MKYTQTLADQYIALWNGLAVSANRKTEAINAAKKILANKDRYVKIQELTGVPWHFIALCHYRESSLNFNKNLANGQPLNIRTTIEPKGRGPYKTFEESAIDSLVHVQGYNKDRDWSLPMYIYTIEGYNGYGYHARGIPSPYLVGGSIRQKPGKYVSDGQYSSTVWDPQLGVLTILRTLMELDPSITFGDVKAPIIKVYKPGERAIMKGYSGDDVKWLQEKFNLTADGVFGASTENNVKSFQKAHGLVADGIIGPKTWTLLLNPNSPVEQPKISEHKIYVFTMYGLGGAIWSGGMETVLDRTLRLIPSVICPPARSWSEWESIVNEIKKLPKGSKVVVVGHSMGGGSATYVAHAVPVDLIVLYDTAGQVPSRIGANAQRVIDIFDTAIDIVPNFRVSAEPGYEDRIIRWTSQYGHTGQDDSLDLALKVKAEVAKLAA